MQVRAMRQPAREMLLGTLGDAEGVSHTYLVHPYVLRHAGLKAYDQSTFTRDVWDAFAKIHATSFALGIAIGALAPWIGAEKKDGTR